jgi:hypothetical protein
LNDDQWDIGNEQVYGIIKHHVLEGSAWAYLTDTLNHAKDGCGAYGCHSEHIMWPRVSLIN